MDWKPDISQIKQENESAVEDKNDFLDFCFDAHVKNEIDWDSLQPVLAANENQNYYPEMTMHNSKTSKTLQELTNFGELKQESCVIENNVECSMDPEGNCQDKISYEELIEQSPQTCVICGEYFTNCFSLFNHNLIHLEVPLIVNNLFMCEHCPQYYTKKKYLRNHVAGCHYRLFAARGNEETKITKQKHKCLICNKTYNYKTWFSHMKEVHCERKFKCLKCNLSFKAERYLKRHNMFVHEGVNRNCLTRNGIAAVVQCPKCPAVMNSKYALTTHLRNCHSQQTFVCHLCKSVLKCKSYLLGHMKRVHYNDGMMHECDVCGKEFKSNRYLRVHIKNSHRVV